jgi:hypothetical protein
MRKVLKRKLKRRMTVQVMLQKVREPPRMAHRVLERNHFYTAMSTRVLARQIMSTRLSLRPLM